MFAKPHETRVPLQNSSDLHLVNKPGGSDFHRDHLMVSSAQDTDWMLGGRRSISAGPSTALRTTLQWLTGQVTKKEHEAKFYGEAAISIVLLCLVPEAIVNYRS